MSEDIASLRIKVDSLEAAVANKRLQGLARSGVGAERATDGLTSSFMRFAGPAAIAAGAVAGLVKVTAVTREFDVLNAQLITATGNADNAARAFVAIQDFATQTPYDLQQATEGFTKLVNLGLTPSERAMRSYGDTASAMGKDMIQMVEAVADATTGEFERLKEFGIRSKKEGDNVTFTFRGVKETVKFNSAEIEEYLTKLGENNFAGAMTERMKTLDGAMSNMGDAWDKAFLTISKSGVGDVIETTVRMATSALDEFTAMLDSGQMGAQIQAIIGQFSGIATAVADAFDFIAELWSKVPGEWKKNGDSAVDAFIFALKHLPIEVETLIKLMAVEIASLVDYGQTYGEAFAAVLGSEFAKLVEKAKVYGEAIAHAINPFSEGEFDLESKLINLDRIASDMATDAFSKAEKKAELNKQVRRDSIMGIMDERTAALGSFDAQIEKGEELRNKWDQINEERSKQTGDRLAEFKVGGSGEGEDATNNFDNDAIEKLRLSLRTEEEVIQESYDRRLEMLLANTEEGSIQQNELKQRLDAEFAEQALGEFSEDDSFEAELTRIQEEFEQRRELILNNTKITEEERTKLEEKLTKGRNDKLDKLENARIKMVVGASAQLFGSLADLAKVAGDEQSKTYKAMFAVSKAFSIAESIMSIQTGIAKAAELGWPMMIPALASVVSTTAGVVSTIQGTSFSAHDNGGQIPAGGVGLVGEFGPEFISGPAQVMSRKQTMDAVRGGGGGSTVVNIINQVPETEVEERRTKEDDGSETIDFIIKQVKTELTTEIAEGGTDFTNTLETTYANMSRSA